MPFISQLRKYNDSPNDYELAFVISPDDYNKTVDHDMNYCQNSIDYYQSIYGVSPHKADFIEGDIPKQGYVDIKESWDMGSTRVLFYCSDFKFFNVRNSNIPSLILVYTRNTHFRSNKPIEYLTCTQNIKDYVPGRLARIDADLPMNLIIEPNDQYILNHNFGHIVTFNDRSILLSKSDGKISSVFSLDRVFNQYVWTMNYIGVKGMREVRWGSCKKVSDL